MYGFNFVNLYRSCIALLFASLSFSIAQECEIVSFPSVSLTIDHYSTLFETRGDGWTKNKCSSTPFTGVLGSKYCFDDFSLSVNSDQKTGVLSWKSGWVYADGRDNRIDVTRTVDLLFEDKEICEPEPPKSAQEIYDDWLSCSDGKSSPVVIPSPSQIENLGGKPLQKLICDNPKIDELIYFDNWNDYANGSNPHIYNPSDFEGGGNEGGGNEGGGNEGGGNEGGGNDNPIVPNPDNSLGGISGDISGGDGEGGASSSMEITLEGNFLTSEQLADQLNQYYDRSKLDRDSKEQSDISDLNAMGDYFEGLYNSEQEYIPKHSLDVREFEETYQFKLGDAVCPPPYVLSFVMFGRSITYELKYDFLCDFALIIGYLVLASAYMTSAYIYLGLRKV